MATQKVVNVRLSDLGHLDVDQRDKKLKTLNSKEVKISGYLQWDNGYFGLTSKPKDPNIKIYILPVDPLIGEQLGKKLTFEGTVENGLLTKATVPPPASKE